jgi:oligosaccharide translocation protein RFT1
MESGGSSSSLLGRSFASAVYLVALQLASRLVTFALNQILLRLTTPAAFGTATIHLELLVHTIVFLSGEGVKDAILRTYSEDNVTDEQRQRLVNTSYIPLFCCGPLAVVCCFAYTHLSAQDISRQPFFGLAVALYGVAAVLELAALPFFIRVQARLDTRLRVAVEGSAVLLKAVMTLAVMFYMKGDGSLLAYGCGQVAYGGTLLARYVYAYTQERGGTSAAFRKTFQPSQERYAHKLSHSRRSP